ncbi:MAG: DUF2878 domain-containing protein [Pseudomonadota bacterium]
MPSHPPPDAAPGGGTPDLLRLAGVALEFIAFKAVWLACVLGAAHEQPGLGPTAFGVSALAHAVLLRPPASVWWLVLGLSVGGFAVDSIFASSQLPSYAAPVPLVGLAPVWIVTMWANFALLFGSTLRWLHHRYALAGLMGAIGGPAAYLAGRSLGGVTFTAELWLIIVCLAFVWALAVPLCGVLMQRLGQRALPSPT